MLSLTNHEVHHHKVIFFNDHQFSNKSLREAWDQFKGLLQKTHSHGFRKLVQINMYIDGLRPYTRQFHDSSANAN